MKIAFSIAALTATCLVQSATASDSIELELAVHNLARTARRANMDSLLIVVRRDARSDDDQDMDQIQTTLENQLRQMLHRESGVTGQVDRKITQQASHRRVRRNLTVSEAAVLLRDSTADGVISADFQKLKGRFSLKLSLVGPVRTHFHKTVTLESRPQADAGPPETDSGQPRPGSVSPARGPVRSGKSAQPFSGYVVTRATANGLSQTVRPRGRSGSAGTEFAGRGKTDPQDVKSKPASPQNSGNGKRGQTGPDALQQSAPDERSENSDGSENSDSNSRDTSLPAVKIPNSPVARGVLRFAASQIGKQVGNGQCWTLAAEAMKAAGASPPQGYTYGDEIALENIQPGDILQFTRARFDEPGYWAVMGTPNHTAVVYSLGNRTFILHQNFSGRKFVQTFDLDFDNLTSGTVQAYRPRPAVR